MSNLPKPACEEYHGWTTHTTPQGPVRVDLICTRSEGHDGLHRDADNPPAIPAADTAQPMPLLRAWPAGTDLS